MKLLFLIFIIGCSGTRFKTPISTIDDTNDKDIEDIPTMKKSQIKIIPEQWGYCKILCKTTPKALFVDFDDSRYVTCHCKDGKLYSIARLL